MTQSTEDNRQTSPAAERSDGEHLDPEQTEVGRIDPLDEIAAELDGLAGLDPADAVPVLANITAELNKELDADTDRS